MQTERKYQGWSLYCGSRKVEKRNVILVIRPSEPVTRIFGEHWVNKILHNLRLGLQRCLW